MKYRVIVMDNMATYEDHRHETVAIVPAKDSAAIVKAINDWILDYNKSILGATWPEVRAIKRKRPPYKLPASWMGPAFAHVADECRAVDVPTWLAK